MIDDYDYLDNDLPKRNDNIYKEIESFEDYEYTNCIAFEMAIRNDEVKKLLDKTNLFNTIKRATQNEVIDSHFDNILLSTKERKDVAFELSKYGFNHKECVMHNLHKNMANIKGDKLGSTVLAQSEYTKLTDILSKSELDIVCKVEISLYNQMPWVKEEKDKMKTNEDFLKIGNHLEWIFHETNEEIIKDALKRTQKIKIKNQFSRPILELPYTTIADIQINLSIPKDELIAYITKLKEEYDTDNSMIKTPLEHLGEKSENSSMTISKKKIADKFFVYDYVKVRLKEIDELNQEEKLKYDEKIQWIKNNSSLTGSDKKIQIQTLKHDQKENLINTTINDIFKDEKLNKEITKGTAKRYYYEIKPFIDELKYKELITGISNNAYEYEKIYTFEVEEVKNKN